jgi:NADH pyrophosphatase NudC (nudix superfamily)
MGKKILALIKSDSGKYLLLKMNKKIMFLDEWYVVTGSVEDGENFEEACRREVREETKLEILEIKDSEISFDFVCQQWNEKAHEKIFLVIVKESNPVLSEEHTDFLWLKKEEFFKKIYWYGENKKSLKELLNKF